MYSTYRLALKYVQYLLHAGNGKGHGIHSPFVYEFVTEVLQDQRQFYAYPAIEGLRERMLSNYKEVDTGQFGAGSAAAKASKRRIADIAKTAAKRRKYGQLLYRIVDHYQPNTILELGTSLGLSSAYLAAGNLGAGVFTLEGSSDLAAQARQNFDALGLQNIEVINGDFDQELPKLLSRLPSLDLAFIDGNHRKAPTLKYFDLLCQQLSPSAVLIFDDVHWSREMEEAWLHIQADPRTMLSVDLFFLGIVFFNTDFKQKQHFVIRF